MSPYLKRQSTLRQRKMAIRKWMFSSACRATLLIFLAIFGVLYLLRTSAVATNGYEINNLEKQVNALQEDNQKLELEIADNRSMKSIQERLNGMGLVVTDSMEYVTLISTAVARR